MIFWTFTKLPNEIISILEKDIKKFDNYQKNSNVSQFDVQTFNTNIRNSKHTWINTDYWIGGFLWYYIQKINKQNFIYDLYDIDNATIQYTKYDLEDYYDWHKDGDVDTCYKQNIIANSGANLANDQVMTRGECVRKLSFSLQLTNPNTYNGGNLEFKSSETNEIITAPKEQGTLIVFDSRIEHRVSPIESGTRKSIVGWVVGPRWR